MKELTFYVFFNMFVAVCCHKLNALVLPTIKILFADSYLGN